MTDLDRIIRDTSADDQASIDRLVRELARRGRLRLNHAGALLNQLLVDTAAEINATAQRIGAEFGLTEVNAELSFDEDEDEPTIEVCVTALHKWTRVDDISRGGEAMIIWLDEALDDVRLREVIEELAGDCRADETREVDRRTARAQAHEELDRVQRSRQDHHIDSIDAMALSMRHAVRAFDAGTSTQHLEQRFKAVERAMQNLTPFDQVDVKPITIEQALAAGFDVPPGIHGVQSAALISDDVVNFTDLTRNEENSP